MPYGRYDAIVGVLRVFAQMGNYALIDRMANALTYRAVESALYDGLRLINTLIRQAEEITVGGKTVKAIDYAKREDERKFRRLVLAKEEEGIRYVEVPSKLPDEREIQMFLNEVRKGIKGLRAAREIAMRALALETGR